MTATPDKVRIALIGCGGFSREVIRKGLQPSPSLQVVACYDPDRAAAATAATTFGARLCDSFDEALAAPGVEAVMLITPNPVHRPQTIAALAAGKHVFVEKPMANTVADCLAMIRVAREPRRDDIERALQIR